MSQPSAPPSPPPPPTSSAAPSPSSPPASSPSSPGSASPEPPSASAPSASPSLYSAYGASTRPSAATSTSSRSSDYGDSSNDFEALRNAQVRASISPPALRAHGCSRRGGRCSDSPSAGPCGGGARPRPRPHRHHRRCASPQFLRRTCVPCHGTFASVTNSRIQSTISVSWKWLPRPLARTKRPPDSRAVIEISSSLRPLVRSSVPRTMLCRTTPKPSARHARCR
jgi:hypothetical protein